MKAAILSPGPWLIKTWPGRTDQSLVIGINAAAIAYPVDVWACGDTPNIMRLQEQVIGNPLLIAPQITMDALVDHEFTWRGEQFASTKMVEFLHPGTVNWPWSSFLIGCLYAAFRGATQIEVHGATWAGTEDFDGVCRGMNRSVDRWREEAGIFGALKIVLGRQGINYERKIWEPSIA